MRRFFSLSLWLLCAGLLCSLTFACSVSPRDCVPVMINPQVVRLKVNQVVTAHVSFSRACELSTTVTFTFDPVTTSNGESVDLVLPASQNTKDIPVEPGQSAVYLNIQGINVGETRMFVTMNQVTIPGNVLVTAQ